jgi:hypothetical protein
MSRLAGAAKHVITQLGGEVPFDRLAAVCAADEETIRVGLLLWQARGKLAVKFEGEIIHISADTLEPDPQAIELFGTLLKNLLEESRAYRRYFRTGDLQSIITH